MPRSFAATIYLQGSDSNPFQGGSPVGATVNGNGSAIDTLGSEAQLLEVQETAGGTATLTLQGTFDGNTWYTVGYQQVDGIAAPARAVTAIAVAANGKHVYQILDLYPQIRAVLSAVAGGASVIARAYQTAI